MNNPTKIQLKIGQTFVRGDVVFVSAFPDDFHGTVITWDEYRASRIHVSPGLADDKDLIPIRWTRTGSVGCWGAAGLSLEPNQ
jgi:hypothetical protein